MSIKNLSIMVLSMCAYLCAMEERSQLEVLMEKSPTMAALRKLDEHIQSAALCNGNEHHDIEKELDLCYSTLLELQKKHQLYPVAACKLLLASTRGNEKIINFFIDAGFDIEAKNEAGQTPLMCAALYGNCYAVKALLEHGANIHAKDIYGKSAKDYASLNYAAYRKNPELFPQNTNLFSLAISYGLAQVCHPHVENPFEICENLLAEREKSLSNKMM